MALECGRELEEELLRYWSVSARICLRVGWNVVVHKAQADLADLLTRWPGTARSLRRDKRK